MGGGSSKDIYEFRNGFAMARADWLLKILKPPERAVFEMALFGSQIAIGWLKTVTSEARAVHRLSLAHLPSPTHPSDRRTIMMPIPI